MSQRLVFTVSSSTGEQPPVPCPFCGHDAHRQDDPRMFDGSLWRCACWASGLSCIPPDLDETADQFLDALGLTGARFSEPAVPVGCSGHLSVRPYDSPKVLRQLTWFFEGRGYETAFHEVGYIYRLPDGRERPEHTSWFFWIRKLATRPELQSSQ